MKGYSTITIGLLILLLAFYSQDSKAELAGKKVVTVTGFDWDQYFANPDFNDDNGFAEADNFAREYFKDTWWGPRPYADARLVYPMRGRLTNEISQHVHDQIKTMEEQGLCRDGCIFVTHSTGDLVMRYAISRLQQWGIDERNFKILAVLDFAGAGRGTELSNTLMAIRRGQIFSDRLLTPLYSAILNTVALFPFDGNPARTLLNNPGVLEDLQPSNAIPTAKGQYGIPRLRFAGAGNLLPAGADLPIKAILPGYDDATVAMHSACGSGHWSSHAIFSCSRNIRVNGLLASAWGPQSYMNHHYPVLMGASVGHTQIVGLHQADYAVIASGWYWGKHGAINASFSSDIVEERGWWGSTNKYRLLKDGSRYNLTQHIFRNMN